MPDVGIRPQAIPCEAADFQGSFDLATNTIDGTACVRLADSDQAAWW